MFSTAFGKFCGFEGIVFDEIRLAIIALNKGSSLDNLRYNVVVVPLPAALPLFGTGLGKLGFLGWRRKRRMAAEAAA